MKSLLSINLDDILHENKKIKEIVRLNDIMLKADNEEEKESLKETIQMVKLLKWRDYKTYHK